jgi:Glycosyl transferases group 1
LPHLPPAPLVKRTDIFFAGNASANATIRGRSVDEIRQLTDQGLIIDLPERLPPEAFARRCAEAWMVLSPQGFGWDCFRHYEAPACWSVPLISQCIIERHTPLEEGVHAFYYDSTPGALARVARAALADKPRLARMAEAAHAHVLRHHTPIALCQHMVDRAAEILDQQRHSGAI